jgi:phage terminase small subunit
LNEDLKTPNYDLAYIDYCKGMKYKEIAEKYGVTINTVKSWKTRYKWSKDGKKSVHTKSKKVCTQSKNKKEPTESRVDQVIENPDLTDKQRLFCVYYIRSFNATKAYQKAYKCSYENAMQNGSRMLRNDKVKEEILRLKQERLNREFLSESDIFQKYMDIAFADITDYMTFGTEEVPVMAMYGPVKIKDPETGEEKQLTKIVNTVRFKDSTEVDGTILSEVKQGKDGASIKLSDRMKALQWLSDHMNMATEEQKAKIAQMKAQTERLAAAPTDGEEDGVEIINDADEKAGQNIRDSDTEVSSGVQ